MAAIICLTVTTSQTGAAPFLNLGFDEANTNKLVFDNPPNVDVGFGTSTDLLPGWELQLGSILVTNYVWLNLNPTGFGLASLYDSNNYLFDTRTHLPVDGKYSFAMFPDQPIGLFSLTQTGDVPADAQLLHFTSFGMGVQLFLNGTSIPVTYTYGPRPQNLNAWSAAASADISAYAGQMVELKFVTLPTLGTGTLLNGLDSIYFSPVPEPGTLALLMLGLSPLGLWRLRRGEWRRR